MNKSDAEISFGTDGWRAVIDEQFVDEKVRLVAQAISNYLQSHRLANRGLIVGYDTRRRSRQFAETVCSVTLANRIPTWLTVRDTPTPVVAFEVLRMKRAGAIMITASHNPPKYNGIKFIPEFGGPALPQTTDEIENAISNVADTSNVSLMSFDQATRADLFHSANPLINYVESVRKQLDVKAIRRANITVVFDPM